MQLDWQTVVVLLLIVAAAAYLVRVGWQSLARRRAAACGSGCDTCGTNGKPQMVELGQLAGSARPESRNPESGIRGA